MIGIYNYTVILTYIGMVVSFAGISFAADGHTGVAVLCLLLAGVCDMFDGAVASMRERTKKEKRFGIQIDSLCDLVSFGVLPAIIACREAPGDRMVAVMACAYLLCALIRLAYFNVDEEERQDKTEEPRKEYYGLPVTTAAIIIPFLYVLAHKTRTPMRFVWPGMLFAVAILFISPLRIKKPQFFQKMRRELKDAASSGEDAKQGEDGT